jgi:hypothetical protein
MLLDVGNNDIFDSGVGSIGGVAMGLWGKLVFLGGRGGVVPAAALVGLSIVSFASSPSAIASSSVASSSTPVEWGSSSVITVAAHDLAVAVVVAAVQSDSGLKGTPASRTSVVVYVDSNRQS